jgi:ribose/xylose/arabinose/galactoside ABC-type transport system permease subunit
MSIRYRLVGALTVEGVAVALAFVIAAIFFSLSTDVFLTSGNLRNLLIESTFIVLITAGMIYALIIGGFDLSVGSVIGLSAGATLFSLQMGAPLALGIAAGVFTGLVVGLFNGFVIAVIGVNDFIVTLSMLGIAAGLLQVLTSRVQLTGVDSPGFAAITKSELFGIPSPILIAVVVVVALELTLVRSPYGRSIYAAGINRRAAHLAGVNVRRLRLSVYVVSGVVAGFAGVLLASHLNSVQPGLGVGYELQAIAAAVIGGVSLAGGRGRVWQGVVGALFLSMLNQGLQLMGVDPSWFAIVTGASIVVAVAFDRIIQRIAASVLRPTTPGAAIPEEVSGVQHTPPSPDSLAPRVPSKA